MKITDKELEDLKRYAECPISEFELNNATARSSAYLAIETIHQLRNTMRNNIIILVLGMVLGFLPNYIIEHNKQKDEDKEIKNLQQQVQKLQDLIIHSDKYRSKKDSEQTFSKKN